MFMLLMPLLQHALLFGRTILALYHFFSILHGRIKGNASAIFVVQEQFSSFLKGDESDAQS
jgi:hypothetical protein